MKRNILYYPTINIQNEDWIRNALIYWDEISSIVPMDYNENPVIELNGNVQFLRDEGFFRPISPDTLIKNSNTQNNIKNFEIEFLEIIKSREFDKVQLPRYGNHSIHNTKIRQPENYDIHNDKVSNGILQALADRELIERDSMHSEWIQVEPKTALLYMSLLAKYIAELDIQSTTIGTDNHSYELLNFNANSRHDNVSCFSSNLNKVLPTPAPNVSFEKILDFKNKRKDELLKFRKEISDFEEKISNSDSIKEVKSHMIEFSEKIELEVNELNKCFKDARILTVAKSLKSLISIKSPTLFSSIAAYTGKVTQIADLPMGYTMAGLSVMGGIELFHSYINSRNERITKERESTFSYLYHADREGLIRIMPHNTRYS